MDYAEARAAFFTPREGAVRPLDWTTPARRLRDALEPIATVCFWSEPAYEANAARGLDFLQGYVWGRSSVLGEPEPAVAAAAFGVFEPGLVADAYAAGKDVCGVADMRAARVEGVTNALTAVHGEPGPEVAETASLLRGAALVATTTGRPLFAGWTAQPWPDGSWAQLWQAASLLRELRGDSHLAALVAAGIDGVQANVLTELWVGFGRLDYTASRAWSPEAMEAATAALRAGDLVDDEGITVDGRALREQVERATDAAMQPSVEDLGDLDALLERVTGWAEPIVAHGWFPPDPYKRAAG